MYGVTTSCGVCRALYAVLLHPEVARSGKSALFLSLVFKAMKADVSSRRVAAFAKRLLQVAQEQQPAFCCGCLLMLSETLKVAPHTPPPPSRPPPRLHPNLYSTVNTIPLVRVQQ